METRTRHRTVTTVNGGTLTYPGAGGAVVASQPSIAFLTVATTDVIGKKRRQFDPTGYGLPPSPFHSITLTRKWVPLNGGAVDNFFWFHDWTPSAVVDDPIIHAPLPPGRELSNDAYVLRLLRRSNPMRPTFSVPVAMKEMVDLVQMFSINGKTFAGFLGSAYLTYRFGWVQFFQDLQQLSRIMLSVNSRLREFNTILATGGLRRRVELDSISLSGPWAKYLSSTGGALLVVNEAWSTVKTIWGSVRWIPKGGDMSLLPVSPSDKYWLAVRQVLDLENLDPYTMWQLMPWSWLVDYFSTVGDFFAAYEGKALIQPTDICLMKKTITRLHWTRAPQGTLGDNIRGGAARLSRTEREREVITSLPEFPEVFGNLLSISEAKVVLALLAKFRG